MDRSELILKAAVTTFAEFGFGGTDVQVIADRAGVGKGTVYRHFGNKEELFWATAAYVDDQFFAALFRAAENAESCEEKLRAVGHAYAAFFEENPHCLEIFVRSRAEFRGGVPEAHLRGHEEAIIAFGEVLVEGIKRGEFRDVPIRETIYSYGAVLYGTVLMNCYVSPPTSMTTMTKHNVDIFMKGIRKT